MATASVVATIKKEVFFVLTIQKTNISLTRGDSAYITMVIMDGSGKKLELTSGDKVRCQVRNEPDSGTLLFEGRILK